MPAVSIARWSSIPRTGSPWPSRVWRGLQPRARRRLGGRNERLDERDQADPAGARLRAGRAHRLGRTLHSAFGVDGADIAGGRRADRLEVRLRLWQILLTDRPDAGFFRTTFRPDARA